MGIMEVIFLVLLGITGVGMILVNNKSLRRVGMGILICVFSYICALRPETAADRETYYYYYVNSESIDEFFGGFGKDYFPWIENWYINFCHVFSSNGVSFEVFLFICAFIINALSLFSIFSICKEYGFEVKNGYYYLSVILLFFVNYGFLYGYVVIRGGLSFSLVLFTYLMFMRKKYFRAIVTGIIAVAFHNFSIVIVLILALSVIKIRKNHMSFFTVFFVVFLMCSLLRVDVLITNLLLKVNVLFENEILLEATHYLLDSEQTRQIKKGIVLYLVQNIYLSYLYRRTSDVKDNNLFLLLFVGSFIAIMINDNAVIRITNYFFVFQTVLYVKYFYKNFRYLVTKRKFNKILLLHYLVITLVIPVATFYYMLRYCSVI